MLAIKPLPVELHKVACQELGEVPARIPEDLEVFKTWIQQQPHLKARTDDQFLIQFLRGCKYSLERAKEKIEQFYVLKTKYPDLLSSCGDVDEAKFRQLHDTKWMVALPHPLNGCGPRIVFIQFSFNPQEFIFDDISQYSLTLCEMLMMNDPYVSISGAILVHDYGKFSTDYLSLISLNGIKNIFSFLEKALPLRIRAIYVLNISPFVEKFITMTLPYIPEKFKNRIHFCGSNFDDLGKDLPKKYLPQDCGGENGSLEELCADYNKVWDEYREYFKDNAAYGVDESLRLGKLNNPNAELGVGGTFRKINVD